MELENMKRGGAFIGSSRSYGENRGSFGGGGGGYQPYRGGGRDIPEGPPKPYAGDILKQNNKQLDNWYQEQVADSFGQFKPFRNCTDFIDTLAFVANNNPIDDGRVSDEVIDNQIEALRHLIMKYKCLHGYKESYDAIESYDDVYDLSCMFIDHLSKQTNT